MVAAEVEVEAVVVVTVAAKMVSPVSPKTVVRDLGDSLGDNREVPVQEAPSIQISQPETSNGVICITVGGEEVIFVQLQQPVHGRTYLLQSLNEILTSSAVTFILIQN